MPRGPQGQQRPADAIGCAVRVAQIATGEVVEIKEPISGRIRSGKAGGKARAESMSSEDRVRVAKKAAQTRWSGNRKTETGR